MIFNWLVGGTDGHAKNYSVTLAAEGLVVLSPLYDLATAAPYPLTVPWQRMNLAMKLGGESRMKWIRPRHLDRLAGLAGRPPGMLPARARELGHLMVDHLPDVRDEGMQRGLGEAPVTRWSSSLAEHVPRCLRNLVVGSGSPRPSQQEGHHRIPPSLLVVL